MGRLVHEPAGPLASFIADEFAAAIGDVMAAKDELVATTRRATVDQTRVDAGNRFRNQVLDIMNRLRGNVLATVQPFDDPAALTDPDTMRMLGKLLADHLEVDDAS